MGNASESDKRVFGGKLLCVIAFVVVMATILAPIVYLFSPTWLIDSQSLRGVALASLILAAGVILTLAAFHVFADLNRSLLAPPKTSRSTSEQSICAKELNVDVAHLALTDVDFALGASPASQNASTPAEVSVAETAPSHAGEASEPEGSSAPTQDNR